MKLNGKQIDAALLDMDGTILSSEEIYGKAFHEAVNILNLPLESDWYEKYGSGIRYQEMLKNLHETLVGVSDEKINELIELQDKLSQQYSKQGLPIKKGVLETLTFFKTNHIPMAVVSSSFLPHILFFLQKAGIEHFFSTIVSAEMVEEAKPNPMGYQMAMEKLGVKPENCVVFEDSVAGILAGHGSGATVIHIPDFQKIPPQVLSKSDYVLAQMDEIINCLTVFN